MSINLCNILLPLAMLKKARNGFFHPVQIHISGGIGMIKIFRASPLHYLIPDAAFLGTGAAHAQAPTVTNYDTHSPALERR